LMEMIQFHLALLMLHYQLKGDWCCYKQASCFPWEECHFCQQAVKLRNSEMFPSLHKLLSSTALGGILRRPSHLLRGTGFRDQQEVWALLAGTTWSQGSGPLLALETSPSYQQSKEPSSLEQCCLFAHILSLSCFFFSFFMNILF
jgi:hypothetical protein